MPRARIFTLGTRAAMRAVGVTSKNGADAAKDSRFLQKNRFLDSVPSSDGASSGRTNGSRANLKYLFSTPIRTPDHLCRA